MTTSERADVCSGHRCAARPKPRSSGNCMGLLRVLQSASAVAVSLVVELSDGAPHLMHAQSLPNTRHRASDGTTWRVEQRSRSQMKAHLLALSHRAPDVLDVGFCDRRDRIVHQVEVCDRYGVRKRVSVQTNERHGRREPGGQARTEKPERRDRGRHNMLIGQQEHAYVRVAWDAGRCTHIAASYSPATHSGRRSQPCRPTYWTRG